MSYNLPLIGLRPANIGAASSLPKSPSHPDRLISNYHFLRNNSESSDSLDELMVVDGETALGHSGSSSRLKDCAGQLQRTSSWDDSVFSPRRKPPDIDVDTNQIDHWLIEPHHQLEIDVPGTGPSPHTQFKNEQADKIVLVLVSATAHPYRFRTTKTIPDADEAIDRRGYADLPMAGFAGLGSKEQVETIKTIAAEEYGAEHVVIVDARQESHALLRNQVGQSFSITAFSMPDNVGNMGFSNAQANQRQKQWVDDFQLHHSPMVSCVADTDLKEYIHSIRQSTVKKLVHKALFGVRPSIKTEEEVVRACGIDYLPLFVSDRQRISDEMFEGLIDYLNEAPKNTFYGVHCKGGRGRTTSVMLLIDLHQNAGKVFDDGSKVGRRDFILRNQIIGATLFKPGKNGTAYRQLIREERGLFLCHAHAYFERYPQGKGKTWRAFLVEDVPHMNLDFKAEMMMMRGEAKTWEEADALCKAAAPS
jgi:hypothetical protein